MVRRWKEYEIKFVITDDSFDEKRTAEWERTRKVDKVEKVVCSGKISIFVTWRGLEQVERMSKL